jgi:vancomycin permeability regulator SanA
MKYKKFWLSLLTLAISGIIFVIACNLYILSFGRNIISSVEKVEPRSLAIIFGGGMKEDGITMSEMQEDRVKRGIELYKAGKVQKLMMTGDDGANNGDEVHAMEKYAITAGVRAEDIDIDPHGYNTYKSCGQAGLIYHVPKSFVISQSFHLSRIMYFCSYIQNLDVQAISADLRDYGFRGKWLIAGFRESLARVKAVVSGQVEGVGHVIVY